MEPLSTTVTSPQAASANYRCQRQTCNKGITTDASVLLSAWKIPRLSFLNLHSGKPSALAQYVWVATQERSASCGSIETPQSLIDADARPTEAFVPHLFSSFKIVILYYYFFSQFCSMLETLKIRNGDYKLHSRQLRPCSKTIAQGCLGNNSSPGSRWWKCLWGEQTHWFAFAKRQENWTKKDSHGRQELSKTHWRRRCKV